jgi:hypothetical protein
MLSVAAINTEVHLAEASVSSRATKKMIRHRIQ